MELWDKQEGESPKAYLSFSCYLALEEGRSLAKVVDAMAKEAHKNPTKYSPKLAQLKLWSSAFSWVDRASAWDAQRVADALREFEANQLARRVKIQNEEWTASEALLARANQIDALPLTERVVTREVKQGGHVVTQFITISPVRVAARDAARLREMASKLGRLSTGLETDRIKVDMEVQAQLEAAFRDLTGRVSPELLSELYAYLAERLGERPEERVLS